MNIFKKQKNILNTDFFYILLIVLISLLLSAPLYTQGFYWSPQARSGTHSGTASRSARCRSRRWRRRRRRRDGRSPRAW